MVLLDRLFRASTEVEVPNGVVTVHALGDVDIRQRDELALAEASRFRRLLKDPDSPEFLSLIAPLDDYPAEALCSTLVAYYEQLDAWPEAIKAIKPRFIAEPEGAELDEKLDANDEQQREDEEVKVKRAEWVKSLTDSYAKAIESWSQDKLLAEVKVKAIQMFAFLRYSDEARYASIYLSTEKEGKPYFPTLASVRQTNRSVLDRLLTAFEEVDKIDVWELDKAALKGFSVGSRSVN